MNSQNPTGGDAAPDPKSETSPRRYWIDADGNVHGIILTMEVDHFVEFVDQAIDLAPGAKDSDKPTS